MTELSGAVDRPPVVSAEEWQHQRDELLRAEKEATRTLDALAARRRRLPMVRFDNGYVFDAPEGPKTLLDLFDGRQQLVVYQFMDNGPEAFCPGCTHFTNNVADLQHPLRHGSHIRDRVQYAARPDAGIQRPDGLDTCRSSPHVVTALPTTRGRGTSSGSQCSCATATTST